MGSWLETYRAAVAAWECDHVEHFTTAYYMQKLGSATQRMLLALGREAGDPAPPATAACTVHFTRELRIGDVYHIESGVVESSGSGLVLGHRLLDSASGEPCTYFLQTLDGPARADPGPWRVEWEGPAEEQRPPIAESARWLPSAACVVRPEEVDWGGRLDLGSYVHHASAANVQCQARIGMTPAYMREQRIGFSTFEYRYRLLGTPPRCGAALVTESAIAHVGRSSLRFVHRTRNVASGAPLMELSQMGVHLDMDARRPTPLPEALRRAARQWLEG